MNGIKKEGKMKTEMKERKAIKWEGGKEGGEERKEVKEGKKEEGR